MTPNDQAIDLAGSCAGTALKWADGRRRAAATASPLVVGRGAAAGSRPRRPRQRRKPSHWHFPAVASRLVDLAHSPTPAPAPSAGDDPDAPVEHPKERLAGITAHQL